MVACDARHWGCRACAVLRQFAMVERVSGGVCVRGRVYAARVIAHVDQGGCGHIGVAARAWMVWAAKGGLLLLTDGGWGGME